MFRVGATLGLTTGAVFIARLYGISLSGSQMVTIVVTSVITSFSIPGIPGGSIIAMVPVLTSVGLPIEGVGILLGVDTIPDMFRTDGQRDGPARGGDDRQPRRGEARATRARRLMSVLGPLLWSLPWIAAPVDRAASLSTIALARRRSPDVAPDAGLVSIIVPARNERRNIERCLASVLSTRYPSIEVIVVDDIRPTGPATSLAPWRRATAASA